MTAITMLAAALLTAGLHEYRVELPPELRRMAGRGEAATVTHALVRVAVPPDFRSDDERPVAVFTATSDRPAHSSRGLMRAYSEAGLAQGWVLVGADPDPPVALEADHTSLRTALALAALGVLGKQWPRGAKAPIAFSGFSGGSKYTGWLAAGFAGMGREVIGVHLSGCNENALLDAAKHFKVLDARFRRIPVFLESGDKDRTATPADHRRIATELERAGFENVRVGSFPGAHEVSPEKLGEALDWFGSLARQGGKR